MTWRILAGALLALPAAADVGRDAERLSYLLIHHETEGRLKTRILALESRTRRPAWHFDTDDTFEVRPVRLGRQVFLPAGRRGILHGLDASTGRELWKVQVEPYRSMAPLDPETFVVCERNTRVSYYQRQGGRAVRKWDRDLPGQGREVWVKGDRLYIPTYRNVVCLDAKSGRLVWDFTPMRGECLYLRLAGDHLVVWDWWRHETYLLEAASGRLVWERSGPTSPSLVGIHGSRLIWSYSGGEQLRVTDFRTGEVAWSASELDLQRSLPPVNDLVYHPFILPVVQKGALVAVTSDSKLVRLSLDRGAVLSRWDSGGPVVGLAATGDALAVARPDGLDFYRRPEDKPFRLDLGLLVHYVRAIE